MDNPQIATGENAGAFRVWPAARPQLTIERGEALSLSLQISPEQSASSAMIVTTTNPGVIERLGDQSLRGAEVAAIPAGSLATAIRRAPTGYWLDVKIGPIDKAGKYRSPLVIPPEAGDLAKATEGLLNLTVTVIDSSFAINPSNLGIPGLSIATLTSNPVQVGALNVRKLFGSFRITSVTSDLTFLGFSVQTILKDRNYLVMIRASTDKGLSPGERGGNLVVHTDDPRHPDLTVPVRMILTP